jgi:hypothetical protein
MSNVDIWELAVHAVVVGDGKVEIMSVDGVCGGAHE